MNNNIINHINHIVNIARIKNTACSDIDSAENTNAQRRRPRFRRASGLVQVFLARIKCK